MPVPPFVDQPPPQDRDRWVTRASARAAITALWREAGAVILERLREGRTTRMHLPGAGDTTFETSVDHRPEGSVVRVVGRCPVAEVALIEWPLD